MPRSLSPQALHAVLHDGAEIALLDVREAGQFGESHALFATPVPYSELEAEAARLVPRGSARVVLCDDSDCGLARTAARRLEDIGYSDISVLAGGLKAWAGAGHALFAGVNVPSKLFGELVEHAYRTPRVTAQQLIAMQQAGEDLVIVDGRPYPEYQKMNIPGAICCPNAELPYRIGEIVKRATTKIIVNCAGRTRSIIGAQTLINFGVPNPVFALENGTQGWFLSDLELGHGSSDRYPDRVDSATLPRLQAAARALSARFGIRTVEAAEVNGWLRDAGRATYICDVRTPEEHAAGTLPGAVHAPGGQLIQATDQWIGVRNARIVLVDAEGVRAPAVATWLAQLGCDVYVLAGGVHAPVQPPQHPGWSAQKLREVPPHSIGEEMQAGRSAVFDLRSSMDFRRGHLPGSHWSIRPRLVADVRKVGAQRVILVDDDARKSAMAATDLREAGIAEVLRVAGGYRAWVGTNAVREVTPNLPDDPACIDFLFFVHDRHQGNREAARKYLAWETNLMSQLEDADRRTFKMPAL